jgi:O-antigen ligase
VLIAAAVTIIALQVHKRPKESELQLGRSGIFIGMVLFVVWILIQTLWAADLDSHAQMRSIWISFLLVTYMFCKCVDSELHFRYILWTHVAGCFQLGLIAWTSYSGGRFEGFGASGLAEANAGALQLVTGMVVAGALFLEGRYVAKGVLLVLVAFIVNAVVTTVSRSGFLATIGAGLVFNLLTPSKYRARVLGLSIVAAFLFVMVTNPQYWARMGTIKERGADVVGVDTGGGRLEIMQGQWQMFKDHPVGCGHMCTTRLSKDYIDAKWLTKDGERASHNTFMTMLVDHGVLGGIFYFALLFWTFGAVQTLRKRLRGKTDFYAFMLPAVAGVLAATFVGDLFVQYPKLEVRIWFISLLMIMLHHTELKYGKEIPAATSPRPVVTRRPARVSQRTTG